jgi:hypothetical protein
VRNGEVVPAQANGKRWRSHGEADVIAVADAPCVEALVSRELWSRAQAALLRNRTMTSPKTAGESRHLFTHMLVCAHCGGYMVGGHNHGQRIYQCSTYQRHGTAAGRGCHANTIREADVLERVKDVIERDYLNPDKLAELRARMVAKLKDLRGRGEADRLRRRAAEVAAKIDRGNENLAVLPPDRIAGVVAKVREWESQRDRLLAEVRQLEEGEAEIAGVGQKAEGHLWRLREGLQSGDPSQVRAVLREVVSKVELRFAHERKGKLVWSRFRQGVIFVRPGLGVSQLGLMGCYTAPSSRRAGARP